MCYITEEKKGLFIVLVLFVLGFFLIWGNLTSCSFQSNDKWVYAFNRNVIFSSFIFYYFFT